jgi:hypothetical protein
MARVLPRSEVGLLSCRVLLGFELVGKLIELVEIDTWPEAERMRNRFRHSVPRRLRLFAEPCAKRLIDHILERKPEVACAPLQQTGKIVVDGQGGAHETS